MFAIQFELFFPEWPGIYICRQEISRSRGSARAGFAEGLSIFFSHAAKTGTVASGDDRAEVGEQRGGKKKGGGG